VTASTANDTIKPRRLIIATGKEASANEVPCTFLIWASWFQLPRLEFLPSRPEIAELVDGRPAGENVNTSNGSASISLR
jgi:hypothetical protein